MSSANPVKIQPSASTLPPGKGNHVMKIRCPECLTKRSFWTEEGDPGCMNGCTSDGAVDSKTPEQKKIEALEKKIKILQAEDVPTKDVPTKDVQTKDVEIEDVKIEPVSPVESTFEVADNSKGHPANKAAPTQGRKSKQTAKK